MPTRSAAIAALDLHLNFPEHRTKQIGARLGEAGVIPAGAPGQSPDVEVADFVSLLIAAATDSGLGRVADSVRIAGTLTPAGADTSGAPLALPHDARRHLIELAGSALSDSEARERLRRSTIEFVSSWPEITFRQTGHAPLRFREPGALPGHWQTSGHRAVTEINGSALVEALVSTFGN